MGERQAMSDDVGALERLVPPSSLPGLTAEIDRLSRARERTSGGRIALIDTGVRRDGLALVRVEGNGVTLGGWEIVAVLHHEEDATRVELCAPLPASQVERLREARALCEACRTVRPRTQTWLLREHATGRTVQVGSSCIKPLTGVASAARALARASALMKAHAALAAAHAGAVSRRAPGDAYIDTIAFLASAVAIVRAHGFAAASEHVPTWRQALAALEQHAEPTGADVRRALEIRAWARADAEDAGAYRRRLAECVGRERLSSRELALAASAVRGYNRELYWRIRRQKAAAQGP
jgi:hypothetical protein